LSENTFQQGVFGLFTFRNRTFLKVPPYLCLLSFFYLHDVDNAIKRETRGVFGQSDHASVRSVV
jgi:hypothetical protein